MALAHGTPTATPSGQKEIQKLAIGDLILAGSPAGNSGLSWKTATIRFSSGTGGGSQEPVMAFIRYGENRLICTIGHPFLLADGTIKTARQLIPGVDRLMSAEGDPVEISNTAAGSFRGGVHAVATDIVYSGSLDQHLLVTAGVVTGDYCLEIYFGRQLEEESAADGADAESSAPIETPS